MAKLGQFMLGEQLLGTRVLMLLPRGICRRRIPTGSQVRKSLSGNSFPKTGKYTKEITYRFERNKQQRYRYGVYHIPSSPGYDSVWLCFSSAVHLWQTMSTDDRMSYNVRANKRGGLSGYNLFIGEYINDHY